MVPRISPGVVAPHPSRLVESMNITPYIRWCQITDEYILNLSVPMNTLGYVRRRYIHRRIHRLIDKLNIFLLVQILYSSILN
jgi:hypothetical protein